MGTLARCSRRSIYRALQDSVRVVYRRRLPTTKKHHEGLGCGACHCAGDDLCNDVCGPNSGRGRTECTLGAGRSAKKAERSTRCEALCKTAVEMEVNMVVRVRQPPL